MPKPEEGLDSDTATYLNNQARVLVTIRRRKHLNPHVKVRMLMRMKVARNCLQKKKQKLHQRLKERQVHPIKFHQIKHWYWEKAFLSSVKVVVRPQLQRRLQDQMTLQTLWKAMITLKTTCNNMSTLIVPENGDSTQSISGRSTLLSLKVNLKRRNVVLTVHSKISKMR